MTYGKNFLTITVASALQQVCCMQASAFVTTNPDTNRVDPIVEKTSTSDNIDAVKAGEMGGLNIPRSDSNGSTAEFSDWSEYEHKSNDSHDESFSSMDGSAAVSESTGSAATGASFVGPPTDPEELKKFFAYLHKKDYKLPYAVNADSNQMKSDEQLAHGTDDKSSVQDDTGKFEALPAGQENEITPSNQPEPTSTNHAEMVSQHQSHYEQIKAEIRTLHERQKSLYKQLTVAQQRNDEEHAQKLLDELVGISNDIVQLSYDMSNASHALNDAQNQWVEKLAPGVEYTAEPHCVYFTDKADDNNAAAQSQQFSTKIRRRASSIFTKKTNTQKPKSTERNSRFFRRGRGN